MSTVAQPTPWVYVRSEPGLWTVGFYDPNGKWISESDHDSSEAAAERVGFLSGNDRRVKPRTIDEWKLALDAELAKPKEITENGKFLLWIAERLEGYGENEHCDFMLKLQSLAKVTP